MRLPDQCFCLDQRCAMYTGSGLQWLWVEFDNDTHGSFGLPAQYEYKLVVTRVGI